MRPLGTPQASPHAFAVPSATKAVWMPPAIIEDPDAPPVEEGEGLSVTGILLSLVPGISYYDAYQSWKAGDYRGMFLNGGFATLDVLSLGWFSKARGLRAFAGGVVKSRVKAEVIDAISGEAGNVVGDRLGAEAGLLTEMVVSGVLSGKLNSQDQKVLGFAADGGAKRLSRTVSNQKSTFQLPRTWKSAAGVEGTFSDGIHTFRIDTNNLSRGERFHIHIYNARGNEIAVIQGRGSNGIWRTTHRGRVLKKPSQVAALLRTDIRRLTQNALRNID